MDSYQIILIICFFFIAMIYASVGFGGGSSYIALLAQGFFFLNAAEIKTTALLCNIVVVTGGTYLFYKEGKLNLKKCWPFLVASIPLAYAGALLRIQDATFFVVLGITLLIASLLLWIQPSGSGGIKSDNLIANATIGGGVGFLSGLVGIGGGIFLSPILHLTKWDDAKKISALASAFILVNSISGLAGQVQKTHNIDWRFVLPLAVSVLIGGQVGSRLGAQKFNALYIKRITAVLILLAGINILRDHL
jgi:uncharacterized membrane protein YfcA